MNVEQLLRLFEERVRDRFYGKYAGYVIDNQDPRELGRVRARVPAVLGEDVDTGWCLPCAPHGGGADRGMLFVPDVGDTIWVEFAGGELSRPIWAGCFWGAPNSVGGQDDLGKVAGTELPKSDGTTAGPGLKVLKTQAGHRLVFDDDGGVIILANGGGVELRLTSAGELVIKADKISLGDGATEKLVLGNAFMQLFNTHTHPTGVGPSGPPGSQMMPSHLSTQNATK
jgi:uncharacterized protein involved in type VI secretion and phage assembly